MSLAHSTPVATLGEGAGVVDTGRFTARIRLGVYCACTALAIAVACMLGKDVAFDTLHYHVYAGFSAFHDRFAQDYFAAGAQSYLNPYVYAPFYALIESGLSGLQVGLILAAVHSVILWLSFELGILICPLRDERSRLAAGMCTAALAAVNPIMIAQVGSSFADITTAELALAGWVLLACVVCKPRVPHLICAAVFVGAATALKLTNAMHAVAGGAVLLALPLSFRGKIRYGIVYALATLGTFALISASWCHRLDSAFGNPFFPLFNGIFRSPDFTTEAIRHYRFLPATISDWLLRPFMIATPTRLIDDETIAPDPRYALLCIFACALAIRGCWWRLAAGRSRFEERPGAEKRVIAGVAFGFSVDWVLWLSTSGNGRYFLPMACVGGALCVALLFLLLASHRKALTYALIAIFATQAVQLWLGTELHQGRVPWNGKRWFEVEVPNRLASEPSLYLTVGVQSNSFVAPYLARGSGLVDFSGSYTLGATGANGAHIRALVARYAPHVRMLASGDRLYADSERREPRLSDLDKNLERFGLRVDTSDCLTIRALGMPPVGIRVTTISSQPIKTQIERPQTISASLVSCRIVPSTTDRTADMASLHEADIVFDHLEDACPQLFQPRRLYTDLTGPLWTRLYANTDITAWINRGYVKFVAPLSGDDVTVLGSETEWLKSPPRLDCWRRGSHYYAKVVRAKPAG